MEYFIHFLHELSGFQVSPVYVCSSTQARQDGGHKVRSSS